MTAALIGATVVFCAGLVAGLLPVLSTKLIVRLYPPGDSRRAELVAELFAVPHSERPLWVGQTLGLALTEGMSARWARAGQLSSVVIRALDVALASFALLLFAPLFLVTMLAIRISSHGPVFAHQTRVGRDGKPFHLLKFRTLAVGSPVERDIDQLFVFSDDPRVSSVGRLLRRLSLDELPQFWNVVRGDMSMVGPRPATLAEALGTNSLGDRLAVRPGITGPWQIEALRHPTSNVEMDAGYLRPRTVRHYLCMLVCTPFAPFRRDTGWTRR